MPNAFGYIVVNRQGRDLSPQEQHDQIKAHYDYHLRPDRFGWGGAEQDLITTWREPLTSREGGRRLTAKLQPGDVVILTKLTRLFRSAKDATATVEAWGRLGATAHALDLPDVARGDTPALLRAIEAMTPEFHRAAHSKGAYDLADWKRERGLPTIGSWPCKRKLRKVRYGRRVIPVLDEAAVAFAELVVRLYDEECMTVRAIHAYCLQNDVRPWPKRAVPSRGTIHNYYRSYKKLQAAQGQPSSNP